MIPISANSLAALQRGFRLAPEFTRARLLDAMETATTDLEGQIADAFPSVSGHTRESIVSDAFSTPACVLGVVGSAQISAVAVEFGTRPHWMKVEPLEKWVNAALGLTGKEGLRVAYAVRGKIAREGTKAQRPIAKTWERHAGDVARLFEDAARQVLAKLAADADGATA